VVESLNSNMISLMLKWMLKNVECTDGEGGFGSGL
jgi:hypothetical protein